MHIVIAPDSYKESLSALEVAEAIAKGFKMIYPDAKYSLIPAADGGEGTVTAITDATKGALVTKTVTAPLGKRVLATYGISGNHKTAIIEMAAASGLTLVEKAERNPLVTTSFGTGELILDALDRGIRHIILGIGGSATNDGGVGMLQALGAQFLDREGCELAFGGEALLNLKTIDLTHFDPRLRECLFDVACDVDNPLTGERGASAIFGPQKGATPEMVALLDRALLHYATIIEELLHLDVDKIEGSGAAGGMGAAALAFFKGELRPGSEIVMEAVKMAEAVKTADLVITGEGRIDGQTIFGKTPIGVAKIAKQYNKPVIAIAGSLVDGAELTYDHGIDALFSIVNSPCTLDVAYRDTQKNLISTARDIAALIHLSKSKL